MDRGEIKVDWGNRVGEDIFNVYYMPMRNLYFEVSIYSYYLSPIFLSTQ